MVVSGISMEPNIHAGELVVLRRDSDPGVGDVAAYRNDQAKATFLHRIVARDGDGFVFKGDNLAWRDPGVATRSQIQGVLWCQVPVVGDVVHWLQAPVHGTLLAVAILLLSGLAQRRRTGGRAPARETSRVNRPSSNREQSLRSSERTLLSAVAVAALIAVLCAASVAFTLRPGQANAAKPSPVYSHVIAFDYSGRVARSAVYPNGVVTSADPMFPAMLQELKLRYVYRLETAHEAAVQGTAALHLRLENTVGWQRTFVLHGLKRFTGTTVAVQGVIDLTRIRRLMAEVDLLTGAPTTYTATVEASVRVNGALDGHAVDDPFRAELPLTLSEPSQPSPAELESSAERSLPGAAPAAAGAAAAAWRPIAIGGAVLFASAALGGWMLTRRRIEGYDEASRIAIRHGRLLTDLAAAPRTGGAELLVASMDDLVRVARMYGTAIFHHRDPSFGHEYFTQANGVVHRYTVPAAVGEIPPPSGDVSMSISSATKIWTLRGPAGTDAGLPPRTTKNPR
jgi:hypothetical protein